MYASDQQTWGPVSPVSKRGALSLYFLSVSLSLFSVAFLWVLRRSVTKKNTYIHT